MYLTIIFGPIFSLVVLQNSFLFLNIHLSYFQMLKLFPILWCSEMLLKYSRLAIHARLATPK